MKAMRFIKSRVRKYEMKWCYYNVKFCEFIYLNHIKLNSLFFTVLTFNASNIGFDTSSIIVFINFLLFILNL